VTWHHPAMTTDPRNGMEILDDEACWELLDSQPVGRLAVAIAGEVEIFPMNFLVHERTIVLKTAQGSKLAAIAANARVSFEIDGYTPTSGHAWSVVVKGIAHELQRLSEIYSAQELPLFPWNAAPKDFFVQVTPREIAGRRFSVVEDQRPRG
jgi:nitroimidazol reductase NimA-like FMN-containing flavoprotein (pyridoxamine 5'-phosphate oxidase superfamily)